MLATLLAAPGREFAAIDLDARPVVQPGLGPMLDDAATRGYRRRIHDLQAQLDDADRAGETRRSAAAQNELDFLLAELRRAAGLAGRERPVGATAERARVNVTKAISAVQRRLATTDPGLAAHLRGSVRTGTYCRYAVDPAAGIRFDVRP